MERAYHGKSDNSRPDPKGLFGPQQTIDKVPYKGEGLFGPQQTIDKVPYKGENSDDGTGRDQTCTLTIFPAAQEAWKQSSSQR